MKKITLAVIALFALSACGGGGDDGGDSGDGYKPVVPPVSTVPGVMVSSSSVDFVSYPANNAGLYGWCNESSKYFETDHLRVYSVRDISDSDYKSLASVIQNSMPSAFAAMGFTIDSMNAFKPVFHPGDVDSLLFQGIGRFGDKAGAGFNDMFYTGLYSDVDWASLSQTKDLGLLILNHYMQLDKTKLADIDDYLVEYDSTGGYYYRSDEKLSVCVNRSMGSSSFAEGHFYGVNFAEPADDGRVLESEYSQHELIHYAQYQHYRVMNQTSYKLSLLSFPRWFTEGQATYLAGQDIARKSEAVNTSIDDMNNASDRNQYYREYGLAYSYVHENNDIDQINKIFAKTATGEFSFDEAFDSLELKNHLGEIMTYESYRNNYAVWVPES
jgi:hypothetical protein